MTTNRISENELLREEYEEEPGSSPPTQTSIERHIGSTARSRAPNSNVANNVSRRHPQRSTRSRDSGSGYTERTVESSFAGGDRSDNVSKEKGNDDDDEDKRREDGPNKKVDNNVPSPRNSLRIEEINRSFAGSTDNGNLHHQQQRVSANQSIVNQSTQNAPLPGLPSSDTNERTGSLRSWSGGRPERSSLILEDDDDEDHNNSGTALRGTRFSVPSSNSQASHRRTSSARLERTRTRKSNRRSNSGRSLYSEDSDDLVIVQLGNTRVVPQPPPRRPTIELDKNSHNLSEHQRSMLAADGIGFENGKLVVDETLQHERRQRKRRITVAVVFSLLLLGAVGGAVGYHTSHRNKEERDSAALRFFGIAMTETPSWSPSVVPSLSPSEVPSNVPTSTRQACVLDTFRQTDYMTVDMIRRMTTLSSPQNRALEWIATEDPAQVACTNDNELRYRYLFATVYFATGGPTSWKDPLNFLTEKSVCQWYRHIEPEQQPSDATVMEQQVRWKGVLCNSNGGSGLPEVSLILDDHNLTGTIPEELALLDQFKSLSFAHNQLTGTLPSFLPTLPRLFEFMVNHNHISGPIPDSYGDSVSSQWTVMDLEHNALTGTLPSSLGNIQSLSWLSLSFNQFNGTIPETLRSLATMERLLLSFNRLSGNLADTIEKSLPRSLWYLWLEHNAFTGTIPHILGEEFNHLESLDLRSNTNLQHGTIPSSIHRLNKLWELSLSDCQLTGTLPFDDSDSFPHLETLRLHNNHLQGTIPPAVLGLRRLDVLLLANNTFSGSLVLPQSVGGQSWVVLRDLSLGRNDLSGTIPTTLGRTFPQLEALGLSYNKLTGSIPTEMAHLSELRILSMRNNSLTGTLPEELGNLPRIRLLLVNGNQLTGTVPLSFRHLTTLDHLDMTNNSLTGDISFLCDNTIHQMGVDCDLRDSVNGTTTRRGEVICECCSICCNDEGFCDGSIRPFP